VQEVRDGPAVVDLARFSALCAKDAVNLLDVLCLFVVGAAIKAHLDDAGRQVLLLLSISLLVRYWVRYGGRVARGHGGGGVRYRERGVGAGAGPGQAVIEAEIRWREGEVRWREKSAAAAGRPPSPGPRKIEAMGVEGEL
jgi:hypothetical protein